MYQSMLPADVLQEDEMIGIHISDHRSINGQEAERRLKACGDHCYLIRYSEIRKSYFLTVYQKYPIPITKHFKVEAKKGRVKIHGKTKEFDTIGDLLQEYENNLIDPSFHTIGRPVTEEEWMSMTSRTNKCCTIL